MLDLPLGFHITFGTYGTRLHGDPRGTVSRAQNLPGEPVIGIQSQWHRQARGLLKYPPVLLTRDHRLFIQEIVPQVCLRGGWVFHRVAACTDHVHLLLTSDRAAIENQGDVVRRLIKRWISQGLDERFANDYEQPWWAEGGSVKWIWDRHYFANVAAYIDRQIAR